MKAFILAAGFGTRMRPFTDTMPKSLVPVNGIPLLFYTLAFLKKNKITDVVINLHHQGQQIKKVIKNGAAFGMHVKYSHENKILGTGGGIKKALPFFTDDFIIINGDIITDFDLPSMIKGHQKNQCMTTMALYQHKNASKAIKKLP